MSNEKEIAKTKSAKAIAKEEKELAEFDEMTLDVWSNLKEILDDIVKGCPTKKCANCKELKWEIDFIDDMILMSCGKEPKPEKKKVEPGDAA